ncbi:MAG: TonB-dependent receptor domain-containing protein [Polyangiales bacterium]
MTKFYQPRIARPLAALAAAGLVLVSATALAQLVGPKKKGKPIVEYPIEGAGKSAVILVELVIDETGAVTSVTEKSREPADAPDVFAERALAFAKSLSFEPATKDGTPIKSKIDYHVRFVPPAAASASVSASASAPPSVSASASAPAPVVSAAPAASSAALPEPKIEPPQELDVKGTRLSPRATSDFVVDEEILALAPHLKGGDLLSSVPGIYVGHVEGDAVANNVFLRGFNAEHGQDIEFRVGAVPINIPSHLHGQGYADLNFIIPEVVRSLRVVEGVYDPRQGDFAVAGSAYYDLGVTKRGYKIKGTTGSFGTRRLVGVWAPEGEAEETFGAVSLRSTDGFGDNRGGNSASAMAQYAFELPAGYRLLVTGMAYGARSALPGVIRRDDYDLGRIGYYQTYATPTAQAQSAYASRTQLGIEIDRLTETGAHLELATYVAITNFRMRENFTGFLLRGMLDPTKVGLGDLIEQENHDTSIGASARYRSPRYEIAKWLSLFVEPGFEFRMSTQEQGQNLLQPPQNETWDKRVDATVRGTDVGAWLDLDLRFFHRVKVRGGFRADALFYDVDDRLGNFTPIFEQSNHIAGFRRSASGVAFGPRASIEVDATSWLQPVVSYGEGYRSPQARQLEEGESAPYTKVRSMEIGARIKPFGERLTFTTALYRTTLSDDLVFDATEASLQKIGPTKRQGFVAYAVARPWKWLLGSISVTYVHATLEAPPPATADDPSPAFTSGQLLPYVPPWVFRADVGAHHTFTTIGKRALEGKIGGGFSAISPRPLPHGDFSRAVSLLDLNGAVRFGEFELGLDFYNLLDLRWADTEMVFRSNWPSNGREIPSTLPARHIVAGNPRTILASLTVNL